MALGLFGQDRKKDNELIREYRKTFLTASGRKVLAHMLTELGMFDQGTESDEERTRQDYGKRLLMFLGIWNEGNIEQVVNKLISIPVLLKDADKKEEGEKK